MQIRINGNEVFLAGDFYGKGPNAGVMKWRPYGGEVIKSQRRIFMYPSCLHPGELR